MPPSEDEEFEFRRRMEQERGGQQQPAPTPQVKPPEEKTFLGEVGAGFQREAKYGGLIGGAVGAAGAAASYGMDKLSHLASSGASSVAEAAGAGPRGQRVAGIVGGAIPDVVVGGGVGLSAAKNVARPVAETLMRSALKPTLEAARTGKAARAIKTMLDEGINVSESGISKMRSLIDDLNTEVKARIARSTATVSKSQVASYLDQLTNRLKNQVNPKADLDAIKKSFDEFMQHPSLPRDPIPVQQAQDLKTGTYKALGEKAYGEQKTAETEAQKTLARGLREEIGKKVPEVVPLNARERELLNALNVTERRIFVEMNKNPAGMSWLAKSPRAALGFLADRSAAFKSLAARVINRAGPAIGATAGGVAGAVPPMMEAKKQQPQLLGSAIQQ